MKSSKNIQKTADNKTNKVKSFFYKSLAILIMVSASFGYGTFKPNEYSIKKIVRDTEQKAVDKARFLGFKEPEFIYNDNKSFVSAVGKCVDYLNLMTDPHHRIPSAIIISMAVVESAYGRSRFAKEGNALFGVRTWNLTEPHMKPLGIPDASFGVKKYVHKCESVSDMISIINRHPAYKDFRIERDKQYDEGVLDYKKLLAGLTAWSTNPEYKDIILAKIKHLNLP